MRLLSITGGVAVAGLVFLPFPAIAQDLAAEFAAAAEIFAIPGDYREGIAEVEMAEALNRAKATNGAWLPADALTGVPANAQNLDILTETIGRIGDFCGNLRRVASQTGPRSFEMRVFNKDGDTGFAVNYQFVGGRSYQRSVDEDAMLTRYGMTGEEARIDMYATSTIAGYVEVYLPSPNVLVIQPLGIGPEVYLRCPSE